MDDEFIESLEDTIDTIDDIKKISRELTDTEIFKLILRNRSLRDMLKINEKHTETQINILEDHIHTLTGGRLYKPYERKPKIPSNVVRISPNSYEITGQIMTVGDFAKNINLKPN